MDRKSELYTMLVIGIVGLVVGICGTLIIFRGIDSGKEISNIKNETGAVAVESDTKFADRTADAIKNCLIVAQDEFSEAEQYLVRIFGNSVYTNVVTGIRANYEVASTVSVSRSFSAVGMNSSDCEILKLNMSVNTLDGIKLIEFKIYFDEGQYNGTKLYNITKITAQIL